MKLISGSTNNSGLSNHTACFQAMLISCPFPFKMFPKIMYLHFLDNVNFWYYSCTQSWVYVVIWKVMLIKHIVHCFFLEKVMLWKHSLLWRFVSGTVAWDFRTQSPDSFFSFLFFLYFCIFLPLPPLRGQPAVPTLLAPQQGMACPCRLERCRIWTRDCRFHSLVHYHWATTSPSIEPPSCGGSMSYSYPDPF